MYDLVKWRSDYEITSAAIGPPQGIQKAPGRFTGRPEYAALPGRLDPKSSGTDPLSREAPTRSPSSFYQNALFLEFLVSASGYGTGGQNFIQEDLSNNPDAPYVESTLDTLYRVSGGILYDPNEYQPDLVSRNPAYTVMTYYHAGRKSGLDPDPGRAYSNLLFTGFPIWWPQRDEAQGLVDFVLQDLWRLPKDAPWTAVVATPIRGRRAAAGSHRIPPVKTPARPLVHAPAGGSGTSAGISIAPPAPKPAPNRGTGPFARHRPASP